MFQRAISASSSRGSDRDEWTCLPGVAETLYQVAEMVDDYLARTRP